MAVGLLCSRLCAVAEMRLLKGRGCVSSRCLLGVTCDRVSGMGADRAGATVSGAWLYLPDCRVLINRGDSSTAGTGPCGVTVSRVSGVSGDSTTTGSTPNRPGRTTKLTRKYRPSGSPTIRSICRSASPQGARQRHRDTHLHRRDPHNARPMSVEHERCTILHPGHVEAPQQKWPRYGVESGADRTPNQRVSDANVELAVGVWYLCRYSRGACHRTLC